VSDAEWVAVAGAEALPPGAAVSLRLGPDNEVAVFNVDGELYAVDGACPHRGGPLAEGVVRDGIVTCPLHWFRFDVRTGEHVGNDPRLRLTCYPMRVAGGVVEVLVPPPPPEMSLRERLLAAGREWKAADGGSRPR
jgi:nitrite reductase/ring-hydroxylating ferredoxin subunit